MHYAFMSTLHFYMQLLIGGFIFLIAYVTLLFTEASAPLATIFAPANCLFYLPNQVSLPTLLSTALLSFLCMCNIHHLSYVSYNYTTSLVAGIIR